MVEVAQPKRRPALLEAAAPIVEVSGGVRRRGTRYPLLSQTFRRSTKANSFLLDVSLRVGSDQSEHEPSTWVHEAGPTLKHAKRVMDRPQGGTAYDEVGRAAVGKFGLPSEAGVRNSSAGE